MRSRRDNVNGYSLHWQNLIDGALKYLQLLGYHPGTIIDYRTTWKKLARFSGKRTFSERVCNRFLAYYGLPEVTSNIPLSGLKNSKSQNIMLRIFG